MERKYLKVDDIIRTLIGKDDSMLKIVAAKEKGILPHEIPDGAVLFFSKDSPYKEGDFIIIKDKRYGKNGKRITKALSDNEKDFIGRLIFSIKRFDEED